MSPHTPGVAERRLHRVASVALGVSLVVYLVADLSTIRSQAVELAAWYPAILVNGLGAVAFLVLPWISIRALRVGTLSYAGCSLLLLIALVPAIGIHGFPDELGVPWPIRILSTYAVAAVLALRPMLVWCYVAVEIVVGAVVGWLCSESGDIAGALDENLVTLSVTIPFALIALAVLSTGRQLDLAAAGANEATRRDAAGVAGALERRRVELLAHDDILYTLRATALGFRTASTTPSTLARASLDRLDQLDAARDDDAAYVESVTFLSRLRSVTTQLTPDAEFTAAPPVPGTLPKEVVDAVLEAAGEALRNSVIHAADADERVSRTVHARVDDRSVHVSISDDGRGFRLDAVPAGRLGVTGSIVERMRSLPGGRAEVRSTPGQGTSIELDWAA